MRILKSARGIWVFLLIAAIAAGGVLVAKGYLDAEDPTSVLVTVFRTELSTSASATPALVFSDAAGVGVDIVTNPGSAFGQGSVPAGTYKRIKLRVNNQITYSGPNPCGGGALSNQTVLIDDGQAPDAQVDLYFATADDGGGSGWTANGSLSNPFLMQSPIAVVAGQNTRVELRFNTAGTLNCVSATPQLFPPTMSVLHRLVGSTSACAVSGQYWFMHYTVRGDNYDYSTGRIMNSPSTDDMFRRTEVVSGWGTAVFNNTDSTWRVFPGHIYNAPYHASYDNTNMPGMAEHRHNLANWDEAWGQGYRNPAEPAAGDLPFGGTYNVSGRRMIMYFDEGGYIEGAVTNDCQRFAGVNISGNDSDMVFAVKKGVFTAGDLPTVFPNAKFLVVQPAFELLYNAPDSTGIVNATDYIWMSSDFTVLYTGTGTGDDAMMYWSSGTSFMPVYNAASSYAFEGWTSSGPKETSEWNAGGLGTISIREDGMVGTPENDGFVAVGQDGTGVMAGAAEEDSPVWGNHRVTAGVIFPVSPAASVADLAGNWNLSIVEGEADSGWTNPLWGTGDESIWYGITHGDITVTPTGASTANVTSNFIHKNGMTGSIEAESGSVAKLYGPRTECYFVNNVDGIGSTLSDTSCSSGITIPVFIVNSVDSGLESEEPVAKVALDNAKKAMIIWAPIDLTGSIYNATDPCTGSGPQTGCGDALPRTMLGVGIKMP